RIWPRGRALAIREEGPLRRNHRGSRLLRCALQRRAISVSTRSKKSMQRERPLPARHRRFITAWLFLLPMLGMGAAVAQAQDYPPRRVRIISDSGPGSAIDATQRIIGDALTRVWGQQAVLINQPGAGGALAARAAAAAAPDGYTLAMPALSAFVAAPGAA